MQVNNDYSLGQSAEDYLKAIFKLESNSKNVSTNQLAKAINVSPAAASKAIKHLAKNSLVNYKPYFGVSLTEKGKEKALEMIRHHRLLELFLHDILGYHWDEVDEEAERLEHHISEKFEEKIDQLLNHPTIDPHGDPIPSKSGDMLTRPGKPLSSCSESDVVIIVRVSDRDPKVLQYLDKLAMHLNTVVQVLAREPFDGPLKLRIKDNDFVIGNDIAEIISVKPYEEATKPQELYN